MNIETSIVFRIRTLRDLLWALRGSKDFARRIAYDEEIATLERHMVH